MDCQTVLQSIQWECARTWSCSVELQMQLGKHHLDFAASERFRRSEKRWSWEDRQASYCLLSGRNAS